MDKLQAYPNGIYCLDAEYVKNELAAVYFIIEGDAIAIIETATSHSVPIILNALNSLGLNEHQVKYIIPTHIHLDHAGGCGALLQQCPNATILVHPRGLRHMIDPSKLIAGAKAVYGENSFNKLYGEISSIEPSRIIAQEDKTSVFLGHRELYFLHTEGHAKHHFCIFDKGSDSMFTGDTFGLSYPMLNGLSVVNPNNVIIPTTTPIHFDPKALKKSLKRIMSFNPKAIFLTHYGPIDNIHSGFCQLLFWVSFYDALVHNAIKDKQCSEEYLYQAILNATQDIFMQSHGLTQQDIETHLSFDLRLNAQGLYHYSQSL